MMDDKDYKRLLKQSKPRERPRSTVFDDGIDRSEKRQQRRFSEKQFIEEELEIYNELKDDDRDYETEKYYAHYSEDYTFILDNED
jgi:hypothetical protein